MLGALGGGYGSERLKDEYPARRPGEHLTVALNNGVAIGVTQLEAGGLRTGDCVRIDGSGETARVVRAACVGPAAKSGAPAPGAGPQADTLRDELRERVRERMARGEPPAPATTPPAARLPGEAGIRYGRVVRADAVTIRAEHELGLEGVINGVSGAALGNPLPRGDGRAFADVANALGSLSASTADVIYATPQPGQLVTGKARQRRDRRDHAARGRDAARGRHRADRGRRAERARGPRLARGAPFFSRPSTVTPSATRRSTSAAL